MLILKLSYNVHDKRAEQISELNTYQFFRETKHEYRLRIGSEAENQYTAIFSRRLRIHLTGSRLVSRVSACAATPTPHLDPRLAAIASPLFLPDLGLIVVSDLQISPSGQRQTPSPLETSFFGPATTAQCFNLLTKVLVF